MVTLYNVIDTRTNKFYRIAIVEERNAKYYIPAFQEE